MNIAIIGAGNVGKAVGASLGRAGHSIIYAANSQDSAYKASQALGGKGSAASVREAARLGDVVILAVPYAAVQSVAADIAPVVMGKVVVDVTNPMKADGTGLVTEGGPSAAEMIASWMPGAHVVKAFNTLFARVQADPKAHGVELDGLFATDDEAARATVGEMLRSMGFRPVWVGTLARARELEAMGFLNILLQMATNGDWASSFTLVGAPKAALEHPMPVGSGGRVK